MAHIRTWQDLNVEEIDKHLIIVDDLSGLCNSCKKAGISYKSYIDACPECKTEFKFVTTRENSASHRGGMLMQKIFAAFPDKVIIDYSDYKRLSDKQKAGNLFNI